MIYRLKNYYDNKYGDDLYESYNMSDIIKYSARYFDECDGECELRCFLYDDLKREYVEVRENVALVLNPYSGRIMNN